MGGAAATCWAVRTTVLSAAAISGQKGAATGAPIQQRRGAVFVVNVQPSHDGLGMATRAAGHRRRTVTLGYLMQGQKPLAAASMRRTQGQTTKLRR